MREAFANKNLEYVCKYKECSNLDKIKIKYGLEALYTLITKTSVILLISLILGIFKETILLILFYMTLRAFGQGIHANTNFQCWVASILCYTILPLLIKYIIINKVYIYILWFFSFISILLWAPADTPKKPIVNKTKRRKCKIITAFFAILLILIVYLTNSQLIINIIFFSLLLNMITINPVIYKLFKIPFNNYRKFNKV